MARLLTAPLVFMAAAAAAQEAPVRHGPLESREEWLLAQPRLTLPAIAPDTVAPGRTSLRLHLDWGNDFGWNQQISGEQPGDRRFLVDGEHATLDLELRRGLARDAELAVRVPLRRRGPGVLDGVIDFWHDLTRLPDAGRPRFLKDRFRVVGRDDEGRPLAWTETGSGLGRVELSLKRGFGRAEAGRVAVVGRVALPTGTGAFDLGGLGLGAQLVTAQPLGSRWALYAGAGATHESDSETDGIRFEPWRAHGFAALEWRVARRWDLLAETSAASRLVTNLARYPGLQWYVNFGARLNLDSGWSVEGGFSENVAAHDATTDFGIQLAIVRR